MSEIKINNTGIVLRPSSIDTFQSCPHQWAKVFLEGVITIPNARAAIGTAIHKGVEVMWKEAIEWNKKDPNTDMMFDASIEALHEEGKKGLRYDDGEDQSTAEKEITAGIISFVDDIVPYLDIPEAVEKRLSFNITDHPIVSGVSGTVDYILPTILDDVKTSKRKPTVANYVTQQSIYKILAIKNGYNIKHSRIQGIVLKKKPESHILPLEPNIDQAKYTINALLGTLQLASEDKAPIDLLFRCNTKYYLCSTKYCSLHGSCPATKRHSPEPTKTPVI